MSKAAGSLYQQPKSPYWWASYYVDGKRVRESTNEVNVKKAQKFLADKIAENKVPDKRTISTLLDGLVADYKHNHRKGHDWCKLVVDVHLKTHFGTMKVDSITKQHVMDYIASRREPSRRKMKNGKFREIKPAKNATINREVSLLRRAFTLADAPFPKIPKLSENNIRKGFVTPDQYVKLLSNMPDHIKPILQFAYRTGCRRGEILNLKWRNVDLAANVVRLEPGETKNGQGRTIPLTSDLVRMIEALPRDSEYLFTYLGDRIKSIKTAWKSGCEAAGFPDLLFHDLRRTGVRNLVRAGVSEHVAMSISGHRTRAVFDRYNIVSESDQKDAMAKLEAAQSALEQQAEQKLPGRMDRFLSDAEKIKSASETAEAPKRRKRALKQSA